MTGLDVVLILLIGAGVAQGYTSGLLRQLASFVGILAGVIFGLALMGDVGLVVAQSLALSPRIAPVVGFLLVFGVVQVAAFALARLVETVLGTLHLTVLNRLGGGALGAFKAALLASTLLMPLAFAGVPGEATRRESLLYEPIATLMPGTWNAVAEHLPRIQNVRQQFEDAATDLRRHLDTDERRRAPAPPRT